MIKAIEGITIRQTKITGGRRMILIFTREEGKVSAGTHLSELGRGGAALALRPFARAQFNISEMRAEFRTITSAETIDAHFALGEDSDRFTEASFALEFTDKLLPDGVSEPEVYDLLKEYLAMLTARKKDYRLLTISYIVKVMQELGVFPATASPGEAELLSDMNGDILEAIVYIAGQPLKRMEGLTLKPETERAVFGAVRGFAQKHLDLGYIKSERMLSRTE
jgi:recombinational DNA repair protein (RecF pathway)